MQLIAIPGSAHKLAPSGKDILAAILEIKKKHRKEREEVLSSYGWFLHTRKEILAAKGEIRVTTMTKACIGFISTVCSCCLWLLLFSRTRGEESAPWAPEHTVLMDHQSMAWSSEITREDIIIPTQLVYGYKAIISHIIKRFHHYCRGGWLSLANN